MSTAFIWVVIYLLVGIVLLAFTWDDETDESYGSLARPWFRYFFIPWCAAKWPITLIRLIFRRRARPGEED